MQPSTKRPKFLLTTHVQLLQWLHGKQQQHLESYGQAREDVGYESEEDHETAEEKKLCLAKIYLQEIEAELEERGEGGDTGVQAKLTEDVEADRGKLRKEISATLDFNKVP